MLLFQYKKLEIRVDALGEGKEDQSNQWVHRQAITGTWHQKIGKMVSIQTVLCFAEQIFLWVLNLTEITIKIMSDIRLLVHYIRFQIYNMVLLALKSWGGGETCDLLLRQNLSSGAEHRPMERLNHHRNKWCSLLPAIFVSYWKSNVAKRDKTRVKQGSFLTEES